LVDLGLAHLTALELAPVELVGEAARAGFRAIGLRFHPTTPGGIAYPSKVGSPAHRALASTLKAAGVRLMDVEFISLTPEIDVAALSPLLEASADLGATSMLTSSEDPEPARLLANFAALCDLARPLSRRVDLEFMPWRQVGTLAQAHAMVRAADKSNAGIVVDALHLSRSGGKPSDLVSVPPGLLRAMQICDAPAAIPATEAAIIAEARTHRLPPGEGGLPLVALLQALPRDIFISVEMPSPIADATARIARAFTATRQLVERLGPRA